MSKHVENAGRRGLMGSFARLVGLEGKGVTSVVTPEGPSEVPAKALQAGNETLPHHDSLPISENGGGNGARVPALPLVGGGGESPLTMSSREIAELTGKDHRNVTRDIEKMLSELGEGVLKFEHTYRNEQNGQEYRCFNLPKNLTIVLIAGYRADIRLKIVDRWMELESAAKAPSNHFQVPQTHAEALRLAADLAEQVEQQRAELVVTKPKAVVYDTVVADAWDDLTSAVRKFEGVNSKLIHKDLVRLGFLYNATKGSGAPSYKVYAKYRATHFVEKFDKFKGSRKIFLLDEGWRVLAELYRSGQLTMKRGFRGAIKGDFRGDLRVH